MGCDYESLSPEERRQPLSEPTPFPEEAEFAHIKANFLKHYDFGHKLGLKIIEYLALGLGKDRDFFMPWFAEQSLSTLRSIKYLPRSESTVRSDALTHD